MEKQFSLVVLLTILCTLFSNAQDPLINHTWTSANEGGASTIVDATDPFGQQSQILQSTGTPGWSGFRFDNIDVDPTKTYRISFWVKLEDVTNADVFYSVLYSKDASGNNVNAMLFNGNQEFSQKYFMYSWSAPVLPQANAWLLMVTFIKSDSDPNTYAGHVYDVNGNILGNTFGENFSWNPAVQVDNLTYNSHYQYNSVTENKAYFFDPRVMEVTDGTNSVSDLFPSSSTPVAGVSLNQSSLNLEVGNTQNLVATVSPSNATNQSVSWSSSDNGIATVNQSGLVTAVGEGNATITVTTSDGGFTVNSSITVTDSNGTNPPPTGGDSPWSVSGNDISFSSGNVGIGTTTIPANYKLAVDGKVLAEEVRVELSSTWPDYVFGKDYKLPSLEEIQKHIDEKGHLPNIPSAKEVEENGIQLGEMNRLLLEKIEEQMLYILQLEKRIQELENKLN